MDIGNILTLADVIEGRSIPGMGFNMMHMSEESTAGVVDCEGHSCGTVACIAGWAYALHSNDTKPGWEYVERVATDWLALDPDQADRLFYPPGAAQWSQITPKQAARALRNLAITGAVDWDAACRESEPVLPAIPAWRNTPVTAA